MPSNKFLENLSSKQIDLNSRVFDLVVGRVFKGIYRNLDAKAKDEIDTALFSSDDKEKERVIKKYIPNFKKLLKEETKKIEKEIRLEIEKRLRK